MLNISFTDGVSEAIERTTGEVCHAEVLRRLQGAPDISPYELVSCIMTAAIAPEGWREADDKAIIAVRFTGTDKQDVLVHKGSEFVLARSGTKELVAA